MNKQIQAAAKRMAAIIAAGAMAVAPVAVSTNIGMISAYAEGTPATPSVNDKGTITVKGIGEGATVKAYQIVKASYNNAGFDKWELVTAGSIASKDFIPTAAEVTALAKSNTLGTGTPLTYSKTDSTYSVTVAAGEYLILVEANGPSDAESIYNPMIASVSYNTNNQLVQSQTVDATTSFSGSGEATYAKKTSTDIVKKITNPDGSDSGNLDSTTNKADGEDLQVGDTGEFEITTTIPSYTDAYQEIVFTIDDTQDLGFDKATDIRVYVNNEEADSNKYTVSNGSGTQADGTTALDENDFQVKFTDTAYLIANAGKDVKITYKAVLNSNATQGTNANKDSVKLTYTNNLKTGTNHKEDEVYEYTFPLNILKRGEDDTDKDGQMVPLAGAEFTLTRSETDANGKTGTKTFTGTTGEDGTLKFERLDEGTYTLKETKAPAGYTVNGTTYTITITPTYDRTTGQLTSYKVSAKDDKNSDVNGEITVSNPLVINDTKMTGLPSTGARSALILTICGIAVMVVVLAASRKKIEE